MRETPLMIVGDRAAMRPVSALAVSGPWSRQLCLLSALFLVALLAGCAGVPVTPNGTVGLSPSDEGRVCRASAPNLHAAYNRRYTVLGRSYTPLRSSDGYEAEGTASWYGSESGSTTAMGTSFRPQAFSAASRILPLPTCVQVTNMSNGRSALVLVNDRGPFVGNRIMDLSYGAAKALGITRTGTARVRVVAMQGGGSVDATNIPSAMENPSGASASASNLASVPPRNGTNPAAPEQFAPAPLLNMKDADASAGAAAFIVQPLLPVRPASAPTVSAAAIQATQRNQPSGDIDTTTQATDPTVLKTGSGVPDSTAASTPATVASTGSPQNYVQTGAFALQQNAQDEQQRLQAAGVDGVVIAPVTIHGKTYYRVLVGPLPQATPGMELQQKLMRMGVTSYKVVQQ